MKSGFIGIIGKPNVGKSTLLNSILGEKVAITTDKPQTTRNRIRGIYTRQDQDLQMIFIDTPGIHKPKNKLGDYMTTMAFNTLGEVDIILLIVDNAIKTTGGTQSILDSLKKVDTPKILVINKIDKLEPAAFEKIYGEYEEIGIFDQIIGTCAKTGKNVEDVINATAAFTQEGPMYFPEDIFVDCSEQFLVSEIIREKLLLYLEQEIPHGVAVEIESFEEQEKIIRIGAVIYCEKKSHKGIIIGKGGRKLKGVGKKARQEIEGLLGTKVYLECWVKIKEKWRDSEYSLSGFGFNVQQSCTPTPSASLSVLPDQLKLGQKGTRS